MSRIVTVRQTAAMAPLATYLRAINATPLLSAEQEKILARRIADGCTESRDHLVRANLRLVVNLARSVLGKGLPLEDLIEEGNLGLLRAVEGFDPEMNTRFSTYASYWIKQSMKRGLVNTVKTVRVPAYMVELLTKWRRATNQLTDELGRAPTQDEVAGFLGMSKKKMGIVKKALRVYNSAPQTDSSSGDWLFGEALPDERTRTPDEVLCETDDLTQVVVLLAKMDGREAAILRMRFALDGGEPMTLKEVGEQLGLTRERVRQLESEALSKLRSQLAV
ncbi:MAG TPA: RNA polymerase sigma factor RpoD/SigA [Gemmataceae bacterium]|nr:RNA polymerase sigma factor RpoD/SigA [Gemmataceae bacterium]